MDGYREWKEKLSRVPELDITVSDILEVNATAEDREKHVDIADLLIRQHRQEHMAIIPVEKYEDPRLHPTFIKLKELVDVGNMEEQEDVDYMEELALLVNELDLEVEGVRKG